MAIWGRSHRPEPSKTGFADQQFQPIATRLFPLLHRALPQVDPAELGIRIRLIVAIVTTLFATAPGPGEPGPLGADDVDEQLRRLLAFCVSGLTAPPSIGRSNP